MNEMLCPLCKHPVRVQRGQQIDSNDGFTVDCVNLECGMSDWGHGSSEKNAYEVFKQKCGITGREKNSDTEKE